MPLIYNGVTIPENIADAFIYNGVSLTQVVYNGVTVWTQALYETIGLFYGGFNNASALNTVTRISSLGALVGAETAVETIASKHGGAPVGSNGLFYSTGISGYLWINANKVTRISSLGALVGAETTAGAAICASTGAPVGGNGLFYGGYQAKNKVTRISSLGALVGAETAVGTARYGKGGSLVGDNGLFYGGEIDSILSTPNYNTVTRISSLGALVGSETAVGTARANLAGASVGGNGLFYAGAYGAAIKNIVTRINSLGTLVGSETSVNTASVYLGGASVGGNGLFYGGSATGAYYSSSPIASVRIINSLGALVGSETAVGSYRISLAGAGL